MSATADEKQEERNMARKVKLAVIVGLAIMLSGVFVVWLILQSAGMSAMGD